MGITIVLSILRSLNYKIIYSTQTVETDDEVYDLLLFFTKPPLNTDEITIENDT